MTISLTTQLETFFEKKDLLTYKRRELLLHPQDYPSSVFYLKTGYVRVFLISSSGDELTITLLQPGDFFPLTYGMSNVENHYFLEAITVIEIWRAPQEEFTSFVKNSPEIFFSLSTKIMVRFDGVMSRMSSIVLSNAYVKVATTLLACAKRFGRPSGDTDIIIDVPLTHRDIATLIGQTRETTSVEMKRLEKEGYVGKIGRLLLLKKIKQLEEVVKASEEELLFTSSF